MIVKVISVSGAYIVNYASGRTQLYTNYQNLPRSVKRFIECHTPTFEKYGQTVNAKIWG